MGRSSPWPSVGSATKQLHAAAYYAFLAGTHFMRSITLGPARTLVASAVLVAVWASTATIVARVDDGFVNLFETAN